MNRADLKTAKWVGEWAKNWGGPYNGSINGIGFGRSLLVGEVLYWVNWHSWWAHNREQRLLFVGGKLSAGEFAEKKFILSSRASKIFSRPEKPRELAFRIFSKGEVAISHTDDGFRFSYFWRDFPGLFTEEVASPEGKVASSWCNGNLTRSFSEELNGETTQWSHWGMNIPREDIAASKTRLLKFLLDGKTD